MGMKSFGSVNVLCSIKLLFLLPSSRREREQLLTKFQGNPCLGAWNVGIFSVVFDGD